MPGRERSAAGNARFAVIGFAVAVIGLALAVTVALRGYAEQRVQAERLAILCDSLRVELKHGQRRAHADSLLASLRGGLDPFVLRELQAKGLADPERDLKADLQRHSELIPVPPVESGRMGFYSEDDIRILDDHWVYAEFDDGLFEGRALLTYEVLAGKIRWRLIAWHEV